MARGPEWREAAGQRVQQWTAMPLLVPSLLIIPILLIPNLGGRGLKGYAASPRRGTDRSHQGTRMRSSMAHRLGSSSCSSTV